MANAIYPLFKQSLLSADANVSMNVNTATDGPFVALVDTGTYIYSPTHQFYSSLSGIVGTDQRITNPTVAIGTFSGIAVTFTAVTGATVEALVIYRKNSGANTTWRLASYQDTSVTGLPVTPNGGDITVTWNASGIWTISDRRLKENVRLVGDYAGVLGIYEYNYIGSERVRLGFMAQEIEKVAPTAVIDLGDHKRVNYDRAFAAADRLAA
jgi:hypothetical protein